MDSNSAQSCRSGSDLPAGTTPPALLAASRVTQAISPFDHSVMSPEPDSWARGSPRHPWATRPTTNTRPGPDRGRGGAGSGLSFRPPSPSCAPRTCAPLVPTAPCLPRPRRSAAPCSNRDFEGPVGQLRLRRLLLPAARRSSTPVAPPGRAGRAGRSKRGRGRGSRSAGRRWRRQRQAQRIGSAAPLRQPALGQKHPGSVGSGRDQARGRRRPRSAARPPPPDVQTQPISGRAAVRTQDQDRFGASALCAGT